MQNLVSTLKSLVAISVIGVAAGMVAAPYLPDVPPSQAGAESVPKPRPRRVVCTGRVEATGGEVDVMAQLSGELEEVHVTEGDLVRPGDLLAVVDARREAALVAVAEANLGMARAELDRVLAGTGEEEIQAAARDAESAGALVEAQRARVERLEETEDAPYRIAKARDSRPSTAPPKFGASYAEQAERGSSPEEARFQLQALAKQYEAAKKRDEALRRGPLPEDVRTAKAAVALAEKRLDEAKTSHAYRRVVAPIGGTVLKVYRHPGDSVQSGAPTPLIRIADVDRLRVRLEVDEVEVQEIEEGQEGVFTVRGGSGRAGRLAIDQVVPAFGPKRLFNPDTSARVDTRTIELLCEVTSREVRLYPGQRITAEFTSASSGTSP